jgi:hypothetical protein
MTLSCTDDRAEQVASRHLCSKRARSEKMTQPKPFRHISVETGNKWYN